MAKNNLNQSNAASRFLTRTAKEVKLSRLLSRILPAAAGAAAALVAVTYVAAMMYTKFGSFTVTVNKFDSVKYALTLSETPDFLEGTMRLNSKASEEITNISYMDLPANLDMINGEHNGDNYVAYTFYMKNAGAASVACEYELYIANMTIDIEEAVRVRFYSGDGDERGYVDYAKTRKDGLGPEPGTTEFYSNTIITKNRITEFHPGDVTKFTVVIWLEGDDPECLDNILGGQFKIDMSISIIMPEESETESGETETGEPSEAA